MLELKTSKSQQIYKIHLGGALNSETASDFKNFFDDTIEQGYKFYVLDCNDLEYISSAGISCLLYLSERLESNMGIAILCSLNEEIKSLLQFLGISKLFDYQETADEALEILKSKIIKKSDDLDSSSSVTEKSGSSALSYFNNSENKGQKPLAQLDKDNKAAENIEDNKEENIEKNIEENNASSNSENIQKVDISQSELNNPLQKSYASTPAPIDEAVKDLDNPLSPQDNKNKQNSEQDSKQSAIANENVKSDNSLDMKNSDLENKESADGSTKLSTNQNEVSVFADENKEQKTDDGSALPLNKLLKEKKIEDVKVTSSSTIQSFYINCKNCDTMLRVTHKGFNYCPECKKQFRVTENKDYYF